MTGHSEDEHGHEDVGGLTHHHTTTMTSATRDDLLYVHDKLGGVHLQSVKVAADEAAEARSSKYTSLNADAGGTKRTSFVGHTMSSSWKTLRQWARKLATMTLCRAHFSPKYVWKNGIVGSSRQYVGLEDEHHEPWTGLFVDLIYVAMCSKVAHILLGCQPNMEILFSVGCMMHLFFLSRFFLDEYNIRFESDGIFHRAITFLYIAGICVMLINCNVQYLGDGGGGHRRLDDMNGGDVLESFSGSAGVDLSSMTSEQLSQLRMNAGYTPYDAMSDYARRLAAASSAGDKPYCRLDNHYFHGFSLGFYITRVSLVLLIVAMMLIDQSNRVFYMFSPRLFFLFCSLIVMIIGDSSIVPSEYKMWPLFVCVLLEILGYVSGGIIVYLKKGGYWNRLVGTMYFPINYLVAQERIGIYILVVLGESMLMLLTPTWTLKDGSQGYLALIFALLLVFMYAMQYYDQVIKEKSEMHAARRDIIAGYTFFICHGPLGYALLIMSTSIYNLTIHWDSSLALDGSDKNTLSWSCFASAILMQFMRIQHKGWAFHFQGMKRIAHVVFRFFLAAVHLAMLGADVTPIEAIVVHATVVSTAVISDIVFRLMRGDVEINVHRQRRMTMLKLENVRKGLQGNEHVAAASIASGAPVERRRQSLMQLQAYDPTAFATNQSSDLQTCPSKGTLLPELIDEESEEDENLEENQHTLSDKDMGFVKDADIPSSSDNNSDDVMDNSKHQSRQNAARQRSQSARMSANNGQSGSSNAQQHRTFFSLDGEDEEEQALTMLHMLADGDVDAGFVDRYTRASEDVRRMSVSRLTMDSILGDNHETSVNSAGDEQL